MAVPIFSMITSSAIDGCKLLTSEIVILLELENNGQFCMAKSIQSLNDDIFKNYLQEARWGFPIYAVNRRPTASQMLGGDAYMYQ